MPPSTHHGRDLWSRILVISSVFAHASCEVPRLPPATGSPLDILIVGEPAPASGLAVLRSTLGESFPPLRPEEPGFRLLAGPKRLQKQREKNVLVLGRLEARAAWEARFGPWLRPAARDSLRRHGAGWFVFRNVWARGQEVVLLVARGETGLDSLLAATAPALRRHWQRSVVERSVESAWSDTATAEARHLKRVHGFVLAVPPSYTLFENLSAWTDAVEMVQAAPSRTVSVFWLEGVDEESLGRDEFLLGLQEDAMWRLHADEVVEGATFFFTPSWDPARRVLHGTWQNRRDVAGGPFLTHFVYDASRRRLYGVQALLFAPGRRKAVYLVELEALLRTFHMEGKS